MITMPEKRRRYKIYRDEAKERLTNHWDWDYMGYEDTSFQNVESPSPESAQLVEESPTPTIFARLLRFFRRSRGSD